MVRNLLTAGALLSSFAILCLGHGLQSVLLPARGANFEDYPNMATGIMMSAYYVGFIGGTFACARLIGRVGHSRVFAAAASMASIIMLCHALMPHPLLWVALRVVYGFCFVHLYTVMESWLNSIGDAQSRGKILSVYMIINFLAMSGGQLLFFVGTPEDFQLFSLSAILLSFALVPLTLSNTHPSSIAQPEIFSIRRLFAVSPLGVAGALTAGLMGGAYWGLTAVFMLRMGFGSESVSWFMSASLVGGLLAQWPLGQLSDRVNRRFVILLALALIGSTSALLTWLASGDTPAETFGIVWFILAGAVFGAGLHPLYSLCIAHANDFVAPEHFVGASAGLQLVQGVGAVAGPLLAGLLMYLGGSGMLFVYIGSLAGLFMLYTLTRAAANRQPSAPAPFQLLTRTGILAFRMDPRYRK